MMDVLKRDVIRFWFYQPEIQRVFVVTLIIGVITAIIAWFVWFPVHQEVQNQKQEISMVREHLVDAVYSRDATRVYEQSKKEVSIVEKKLAVSVHQAGLVKNLARLGGKHRVRILSETYEDGKISSGYFPLHHELNVRSSYPALRAFLVDLQALPSWTVVKEITAERMGDGDTIKAKIRMTTYRTHATAAPEKS